MNPPAAVFVHPVRVYWEDTDAGGIVFYANYLKFFERARTEWLRALGLQQQALREETGLIFVVSATAVRHLAPARLDDLLQVSVQVAALGRATITLAQQARRNGLLLAEGTVRVACADAATLQPQRLPGVLLRQLQTLQHPDANADVASAAPACNNPDPGGTPAP
jgi:acyl-CoA thioester hydrolase